jgi:hypothetical protein
MLKKEEIKDNAYKQATVFDNNDTSAQVCKKNTWRDILVTDRQERKKKTR